MYNDREGQQSGNSIDAESQMSDAEPGRSTDSTDSTQTGIDSMSVPSRIGCASGIVERGQ